MSAKGKSSREAVGAMFDGMCKEVSPAVAAGVMLRTILAGARPPVSRKLRQDRLDQWLRDNRGRVERESANAIALELRRLEFYSAKTSTTDIKVSFWQRCCRLGLPFKGKMT